MGRCLASLLFLLVPWQVWAGPAVTLGALEGEVRVLRAGAVIPSERITEGFALEPYDTVTAGATGRADLRIPAALGPAASVRLDPGTSVSLDFTAAPGDQSFGLEMLAGAVSVRITAGSPASSLEIRTGTGAFSGTQASYRLVTSPLGDLLVAVAAGKVQCRFPGRTVYSEPGSVVESLAPEGRLATYSVNDSTLAAYESAWSAQRLRESRDQAAVYFRALGPRYQLAAAAFQRAWDRSRREAQDGPKALASAAGNLLRVTWPLERSLFRIQALRGYLDDGVLSPSVELSRGFTAREFFRLAALDEKTLTSRLAEARALFRSAQLPAGAGREPSGAEVTYDSAFFH